MTTTGDLFAVLAHVQETEERHQLETLHDAIKHNVASERQWARELTKNEWAPVLAAMTSRQKWLAQELWDQSRDALSRVHAHVAAGRITEATCSLSRDTSRYSRSGRVCTMTC